MNEEKQREYSALLDLVITSIRENGELPEEAIFLWFGDIEISNITKTSVVFSVKTEFKYKTLSNRYTDLLERHLEEILGYPKTVEFLLEESKKDPNNPFAITHTFAPSADSEEDDEEEFDDVEESEEEPALRMTSAAGKEKLVFNRDYTFENFVVGGSNSLAHAAARAVAENPARKYNPFFLYGPSGVGKTHLMYAITNKVMELYPKKKIAYVKGEEFANQLIESISKKNGAAFREKFRTVDMLLIDDVHFIAGRATTQEEFFHTFNTLFEQHKQIVVSSDLPPKDMPTLEERIKTRFESGLIADIQAPDYDLRIAIMRTKAKAVGISLSPEVEVVLAENLTSNIRQIEGVIKKISAIYYLSGEEPTIDTIRTYIPEFLHEKEAPEAVAERIIESTCDHFGIMREDIIGAKRDKEIKNARNAAIYIIHKETNLTLKQIGKIFSDRTHSTVYSNFVAAEAMMQTDKYFATDVGDIVKNLKK